MVTVIKIIGLLVLLCICCAWFMYPKCTPWRARHILSEIQQYTDQPWEINRLRRHLGIHEPECLDNNDVFMSFAAVLRHRALLRHYMLHIPRSGGTSLCKMFARHKIVTKPWYNCWLPQMWPEWFFGDQREPEWNHEVMSCAKLDQLQYGMVANERWMDPLWCPKWFYSILLREPHARYHSMLEKTAESKWLKNPHTNHRFDYDDFHGRRELFPNYLTWALDPDNRDVGKAKYALERFDFIVDVSNDECTRMQLDLMGIQESTEHTNRGKQRASGFDDKNIKDEEVYAYGKQLMQVDCAFFERLAI